MSPIQMVLAHMSRLLSFKFNLQVTHIAQQMNHVKPDGEIAIVMMTALVTLFVDKETTLNLFQDSLVLTFQPKTTQMVMMITAMTQMLPMKEVKAGFMLGTLLMQNGTQSASKDHTETPGISPVKKISIAVKFAKTTSLLLMLTVTLAQAIMMPTQMAVETMTQMNSSLLENAVSVEVEALETIAQNGHGTCT
jgi:hypothetical protein